jgi:hypothetical protein
MGTARPLFWSAREPLTRDVLLGFACPQSTLTSGSSVLSSPKPTQGVTVWDLFYVGLTIVVFAVLLLILKGIETFER